VAMVRPALRKIFAITRDYGQLLALSYPIEAQSRTIALSFYQLRLVKYPLSVVSGARGRLSDMRLCSPVIKALKGPWWLAIRVTYTMMPSLYCAGLHA